MKKLIASTKFRANFEVHRFVGREERTHNMGLAKIFLLGATVRKRTVVLLTNICASPNSSASNPPIKKLRQAPARYAQRYERHYKLQYCNKKTDFILTAQLNFCNFAIWT